MRTVEVSDLLRPGLLRGASIVVATAPGRTEADGSLGEAVDAACAALGARVSRCELGADTALGGEEAAIEEAVDHVLAAAGGVDLLAIDAASVFAQDDRGGLRDARRALFECLDASWNATHAFANRAFLPDECGGRIAYLAPAPDAGEHADAACAGLENLARTLSIEWARHGVTAVTIAPGGDPGASAATAASEVAALTAYLASPAGAYFSGCLLDLRGPRQV